MTAITIEEMAGKIAAVITIEEMAGKIAAAITIEEMAGKIVAATMITEEIAMDAETITEMTARMVRQ